MASVFIDVPGVGRVEAINAASESTLRELVTLLGGKKSGGSGGGGVSSALGSLGGSAKAGAQAIGKVAFVAGQAAKAVIDMTNAMATALKGMADLGNSVSQAAGKIPLLGTAYGAVASAAERQVQAFQQATASGATFGGSVNEMSFAATGAGLTLEAFASVISQNGEALRLLGSNTEDGARRFSQLSRSMRTSGLMENLNQLGFTTQEINEGMADYIEIQGRSGKLSNMSNAQLVRGSARYLKELDLLSKVTGQSRSELEAEQKKLLADAQYQATVNGMSSTAADAFRNTVMSMGPGLSDIAKDIMSTGSATTEQSQQFTAMMPQSAALMREYAQTVRNGGTITADMQNRLNNVLAEEGAARKTQFGDIARYSSELGPAYMAVVSASNRQRDALENARVAQERAANGQDKMAAAMEQMSRFVAEVSNTFTRLLANTGFLDSMMSAFSTLTMVMKEIVFPAFQGLFGILAPIVQFLSDLLYPIFKALGFVLEGTLFPAARLVGKVLQTVADTLGPVFRALGDTIGWLGKKLGDFWYYVTDKFEDAMDYMFYILNPFADAAEYEANERRKAAERETRDRDRNSAFLNENTNSLQAASQTNQGIDFSSPEAMAKSFAQQQGSYLTATPTKSSAQAAVATGGSSSAGGSASGGSTLRSMANSFMEGMDQAGAFIANKWRQFGTWADENWTALTTSVSTWFSTNFPETTEAIKNKWDQFGTWAGENWTALTTGVSTWFSDNWPSTSDIKAGWDNFGTWAGENWSSLTTGVSTWFSNNWPSTSDIKAGWDNFGTWAGENWSSLTTNVSNWFGSNFSGESIGDAFDNFGTWATNNWESLTNSISSWFSNNFSGTGIANAFDSVAASVSQKASEISGYVMSGVESAGNYIGEAASSALQGAKDWWNDEGTSEPAPSQGSRGRRRPSTDPDSETTQMVAPPQAGNINTPSSDAALMQILTELQRSNRIMQQQLDALGANSRDVYRGF